MNSSFAHSPTWTDGIACIVYSHCTSCHNDNGIAPFPLLTYDDVYANRYAIQASVAAKSMPPFPPSQEKQQYAHDNTLTQHEIDEILEWVDNFAPLGDPDEIPEVPEYNYNYELVDADLVLEMPLYEVNTSQDLYRVFVLPTEITSTQAIQSIEVVPGDPEIVHHALVFQDDSDLPLQLDEQDPGPGYTAFGGTGSSSSTLIWGYTPGQQAFHYPNGFGVNLKEGTNILIQIHYPGGTFGKEDQTSIRIKYADSFVREVLTLPILNHITSLTNGPLFIEANTKKTFYSEYDVNGTFTVTGIMPHMHLLGESIKAWVETPDGDEITLIDIPNWDFHWQGFYQFEKPIVIPNGSVIYGEAKYDNTSSNYDNPNNPPKDVSLGEGTDDEMMLIYFNVSIHLPGDENIIIDTSSHKSHYLNCEVVVSQDDIEWVSDINIYPNPTQQTIYIDTDEQLTSGTLYSVSGVIQRKQVLQGNTQIDVSELQPGLYFITIETENGNQVVRKFQKL